MFEELGSIVDKFGIIFIAFIISVFISRWIFRIDDIVKNLKEINAKLGVMPQTSEKPKAIISCPKCGHKPMEAIVKKDGSEGIECPNCKSFYPPKPL